MGLNDNVHRISQSLVSERQEKQKQKEQKEFLQDLKVQFKQMLLNELIEARKNNMNIYSNDFQDYIINSIVKGYVESQKAEWQKRFSTKYQNEIYNSLFFNYYAMCSQADRVCKKQNEDVDNEYKKQIALEKWELQRQKLKLQIEREKQKSTQKTTATISVQKKKTSVARIIVDIVIILFILTFAPFLIGFVFFYAFIKALCK